MSNYGNEKNKNQIKLSESFINTIKLNTNTSSSLNDLTNIASVKNPEHLNQTRTISSSTNRIDRNDPKIHLMSDNNEQFTDAWQDLNSLDEETTTNNIVNTINNVNVNDDVNLNDNVTTKGSVKPSASESLNNSTSSLSVKKDKLKQPSNLSVKFIRRLFSCGGNCARTRSSSGSISNSASISAINNKNNSFTPNRQSNKKNTDNVKNEKAISQSETNLLITNESKKNDKLEIFNQFDANSSYESIIDEIVNNTKFITNKIDNNSEHQLVKVKQISCDEELLSLNRDCCDNLKQPQQKLVLPILKINDNLVSSAASSPNEDFDPGNLTPSLNQTGSNFDDEEFYVEVDDEDDEIIEEEIDDEEELDDTNNNNNNNNEDDVIEYNQNNNDSNKTKNNNNSDEEECDLEEEDEFEYEEDCYYEKKPDKTENKSANVPAISFEFHSELDEKETSLSNPTIKLDTNNDHIKQQQQQQQQNPSLNCFYSKFLTANNLLTERGCIVNIRTGSFNLGCQQSNTSDELTDSNEFFGNNNQNESSIRGSISNHSFRTDYDFSDGINSADNGANLFVPLLLNSRRKSSAAVVQQQKCAAAADSPTNLNNELNLEYESKKLSLLDGAGKSSASFLSIPGNNSGSVSQSTSVSSNLLGVICEQDQARRCSHDPNIEKLHKTYINNVKLGQVASQVSVSTMNTDSNVSNTQANNSNNDGMSSSSFSGSRKEMLKKSVTLNDSEGGKKKTKILNFTSLDQDLKNVSCGVSLGDSVVVSGSGEVDVDLEADEELDVLNDIGKVNQWLRDNKNHYNSNSELNGGGRGGKKLIKNSSFTIAEDELLENIQNEAILSKQENDDAKNADKNLNEENFDENNELNNFNENTDSAIDVRSYGSISTLSKASSNKTRVNWQSFNKYYHLNFFQTFNTTWTKYQISAMSLEQLMALRKLALIQFSKLLERQHSTMIRTLRLFSKPKDVVEFQRVYDSIDSLNNSKSELSKTKLVGLSKDQDGLCGGPALSQTPSSVIIDKKKISHQLGAKIGAHPTTNLNLTRTKQQQPQQRRSNKTSLKKLEHHLFIEKKDLQQQQQQQQQPQTLSNSNEVSSVSMDISGGTTYNVSTGSNETVKLEDSKLNESSKSVDTINNLDAINNQITTKTIIKKVSGKSSVVFGVALSGIMQNTGQPLPQKILEAMKFTRKISQVEIGIFRKNGVKTRINKLKELIDASESINFSSNEYTPFDIADTIKLYFRELPECLITNKLSDILLSNYDKIRPEERKIILQQVMLLIPDENRLVLQTLLLFLNEISKYHKINQMTRNNLAVCFSPVIFHLNYEKNTKLTTKQSKLILSNVVPSISSSTTHSNLTSSPKLQQNLSQTPVKSSSNQNLAAINSSITSSQTYTSNAQHLNEANETTTEAPSADNNEQENSLKNKLNSNVQQQQQQQHPQPNSLLSVPNSATQSGQVQSSQPQSQSAAASKSNYRRKYSDRINKAATTIVNFGAELSSSTSSAFFSDSLKDTFENMSKVVQLCVSDMIKYSMDLFTVPVENFEKLKLSVSFGSEPQELENLYDLNLRLLKRPEFFTSNISIDKTFWCYMDKYEDVSIYFYRNDYPQMNTSSTTTTNTATTATNQPSSIVNSAISQPIIANNTMISNNNSSIGSLLSLASTTNIQAPQSHVNLTSSLLASSLTQQSQLINSSLNASFPTSPNLANQSSPLASTPNLFFPLKFENFNDKLRLWKCCTLIKHPNVTLEKILDRIKNERHLWDEDFKEGRVVEMLDENTDLYRYVVSFMPPHPSRDFFELRHSCLKETDNKTIILTSTSVQTKVNKLVGDIRSNMLLSKYVIEQLIATDTTTTFKITHYIKLDYKGFTMEFYNRTFGYIMARLLYNLKLSLNNL